MADITYNREYLRDCLEEIKPILEDHYHEVAMYQDKIGLNPDYDKYLDLEGLGLIHLVTVRDGEKLIGYFISVISPNLHYSDHLYAANDILFLKKEYRNALIGQKMFQKAEELLRKEGVSVITIHMKTALPFDSLCLGMGYDYAERNYTKYIGD